MLRLVFSPSSLPLLHLSSKLQFLIHGAGAGLSSRQHGIHSFFFFICCISEKTLLRRQLHQRVKVG